MTKKAVIRSNTIKKLLTIILALIIVLAGASAYKILTYDITAKPQNDLTKQFQRYAAYDASSKVGDIKDGADVAALQKNDQYENSSRALGVIDGVNKVHWDRVSYDKWETGGGLFYESGSLYGCYRLTANTENESVKFETKACSSIKDLPPELDSSNSKEVTLDKKVVGSIRESYNDNIQCYPGGNAYQYQCND